jgi:hypothetical protein
MAENLPPSSADVTESGSLNLLEPSGPHRPVMGLLFVIHVNIVLSIVFRGNNSRPQFHLSLLGALA